MTKENNCDMRINRRDFLTRSGVMAIGIPFAAGGVAYAQNSTNWKRASW